MTGVLQARGWIPVCAKCIDEIAVLSRYAVRRKMLCRYCGCRRNCVDLRSIAAIRMALARQPKRGKRRPAVGLGLEGVREG